MVRINLAKDPSLRSGTTSAFLPVAGATLSITDDYAFYGENALVVTKAGTNGSGVEIAAPVPVDAGKPYAFSIYARLPITIPLSEYAEIVMQVEWLNSLGVVLQIETSAALLMDSDDSWYRIGGVWTAAVGATFANVTILQPLPGSTGAKIILDALLIEQANYIGGYFDNIPQAEKNAIVNKALSAVPQVINGIRLGADVVLNELVLNTIDENDTVWIVTDIDGWWGQADPDIPDIARGTEDGSYDVEGRTKARNITISGFFIPKDAETSLSKSIDRLVLALNLTRKGGWLHAHEGPTKAAWVRLSSKPDIRTVNARGRTTFQIQLRAGDPIKYHWDDDDPEGYTNLHFEAADVIGYAENIGTATVTGNFTITGPAGAGTRIFNATTDETMTLAYPLRGAGLIADAYEVSSTDGVATIKTVAPNNLRVGDEVALLNMVIPFSEADKTRIVTAVSEVYPYSFSVEIATADISPMSTGGQIRLVNNDTLLVDTYNRAVTYNGETSGHRSKLTTLTDWIHFGPGENIIEFYDEIAEIEVVSKQLTGNVVTLKTSDSHYFIPGETITVDLPVNKPLAKKSLTSNVVTLTTAEPHGFSVGDVVTVQSTEQSKVITKARTSGVATLTTESPHGINLTDNLIVALPSTAVPTQKALTSNVATLTFQNAHGMSAGDSVTVALPTGATVSNKQLTSDQATLTTTTQHNFVVGDTITVALPGSASITGKARSGAQVVMTTSGPHGFATGDQVSIMLPTTATPTGSFVSSGTTNLVTMTTAAAHGYSVGDTIYVGTSGQSYWLITNRAATATVVTLTTSVAHQMTVGEYILVTDVGARYNGLYPIASVPNSTTVTYNLAGAVEASTASSGMVEDKTWNTYYVGLKIIESTPNANQLTFRAWDQKVDSTRSVGGAGVVYIDNRTHMAYNGVKTLVSASGNTFAYNF
jgi:hypothetical protein